MFQVFAWEKSTSDEEEAEDERPRDGGCTATERWLPGAWVEIEVEA